MPSGSMWPNMERSLLADSRNRTIASWPACGAVGEKDPEEEEEEEEDMRCISSLFHTTTSGRNPFSPSKVKIKLRDLF